MSTIAQNLTTTQCQKHNKGLITKKTFYTSYSQSKNKLTFIIHKFNQQTKFKELENSSVSYCKHVKIIKNKLLIKQLFDT